ncbi:MAG: hypothetical protein R3E83_11225 [Burkholderiaceae bacterium]
MLEVSSQNMKRRPLSALGLLLITLAGVAWLATELAAVDYDAVYAAMQATPPRPRA